MSKEVIVESFELDHTIVKAPYIRLIGEETGPKGDIIYKFYIRKGLPNDESNKKTENKSKEKIL